MKAYKAFQKLHADKEDTYQVFQIMRALTGTSVIDGYNRLLNTPGGGKIAYDRVEFADKLMDRAWVESFAPGTLGAAYAEFTARENLSAEGLAEESRKGQEASRSSADNFLTVGIGIMQLGVGGDAALSEMLLWSGGDSPC